MYVDTCLSEYMYVCIAGPQQCYSYISFLFSSACLLEDTLSSIYVCTYVRIYIE